MTSPDEPKRRKKRASGSTVPSRYDDFLEGKLSVTDLDDDELIRGQLKDRNGAFTGRPPRVIPRAFHTAVVRELVSRQERKLLHDLEGAYGALREIASNHRAPAVARNQAAIYLIERVSGKIPDKQLIQAEVKPWEQDVADVLLPDV